MATRHDVELMVSAYAGLLGFFRRIWDSVTVRTKRGKCIVSGCEVPPRGRVGRGILGDPWLVCGTHRKPVCDVLNDATRKYAETVAQAKQEHTVAVVNGLNDLGCHEDELALAG